MHFDSAVFLVTQGTYSDMIYFIVASHVQTITFEIYYIFFLQQCAFLNLFPCDLDLWSSHPNTLNNLENGRSNYYKNEKCYKLGRYRVLFFLFRRLAYISPFGNVLLLFFVSLFHSWCGRHFEFILNCLQSRNYNTGPLQ